MVPRAALGLRRGQHAQQTAVAPLGRRVEVILANVITQALDRSESRST